MGNRREAAERTLGEVAQPAGSQGAASPALNRSWIRAELKKNYDKASRTAREAARAEPRAVEAKYMPASRHLRVRLTNGASLSLPVSIIPELRKATPAQLAGIEILPGGDGLHWEALDFTISVPGLVASLFGRSVWMSELGRRGGTRSTLAKAEAARRNGMRGGRPRLA
jgi:hypothetical protein